MNRRLTLFLMSFLCTLTSFAQVDLEALKSKELQEVSNFFKSETYVFQADITLYQSGKALESTSVESIRSKNKYYSKNSNGITYSNGEDYVMILEGLKRMYFRRNTKKKNKALSKKQEAVLQKSVLNLLDTTSEAYLPDVTMEIVDRGKDRELIFSNEEKSLRMHYLLDGKTGALKKMTLDHNTGYYDRYEMVVKTWEDRLRASDLKKMKIEYYITTINDTPGSNLAGYELIKMEQ